MNPSTVEALEGRTLLSAQFVTDVNTAPVSGDPHDAITANGLTFFVADDGIHGAEMWRTDGTPGGTFLLKDIATGSASSKPVLLGAAGGWTYFQVNAGSQVWRTDGTSQNTTPLSGVFVNPAYARTAVALGNDLYFAAYDSLYRFGAQSGAVSLVARISVRVPSGHVTQLRTDGSKLYLVVSDNTLWVSNGASGATKLMTLSTDLAYFPFEMARAGDTMYFSAQKSGTNYFDLWKTQGTPETTVLAKDFPDRSWDSPDNLTTLGNSVMFCFTDGSRGALWKADGSTGEIVQVKAASGTLMPTALTPVGARVYFSGGQLLADQLWTTDGTPGGTVSLGSSFLPPGETDHGFGDFNGKLLFRGYSTAAGAEPWISDGTAAGTIPVSDLVPGTTGSTPQFLGTLGARAIFAAADPVHGRELWITDGTATGTMLLKEFNAATADASPTTPVVVNGRLVFAARDASAANLLRVMANPGDAPQPLTVGDGGSVISNPGGFTPTGGLLYFTAAIAGATSPQLLVTDGTSRGTRVLKDLGAIINPRFYYAVGDRLYFVGGTPGKDVLYTSDGAPQGTVALTDPALAFGDPTASGFATFKGKLYFVSQVPGGSGTARLWRSDGTPQGTSAISGDFLGLFSLTGAGDRLYFRSGANTLYSTDGGSSPVLVSSALFYRLEAVGDVLILTSDSGSGKTLMRLAPGDAAPTLLARVTLAETPVVRVGRWLYFVGATGGTPGQVWRTDGTPAGTTQVSRGTAAADLTRVGDLLCFTDVDATSGRRLWVTDGTPGGTTAVTDATPGPASASPTNLADWNGTLYFTAQDAVHGRELWRVVDDVAPTTLPASFNYASNPQTLTVTFTENVGASLALQDWTLTDRATGQDVSNLLTSLSFNPDTDTATLTLVASLPKGNYRLTLAAGAAADPSGNPTTADVSLDFFHLPGDINRDRTVNFDDLLVLAKNYNKTGVTYTEGDLTGDGVVNFDDLLVLAKNYNGALPAALASAQIAPAAAAPVSAATKTPTRTKATPVFNTTPIPPKRPRAPAKPAARKAR